MDAPVSQSLPVIDVADPEPQPAAGDPFVFAVSFADAKPSLDAAMLEVMRPHFDLPAYPWAQDAYTLTLPERRAKWTALMEHAGIARIEQATDKAKGRHWFKVYRKAPPVV